MLKIHPQYHELIELQDSKIKADLYNYIDSIKLLQLFISKKRPKISDLPKNKKGLITPSIENPHLLEDMDYFRPAALHFKKHGCYTKHYPNSHPNSEYFKFWEQEKERCLKGYAREDGEWIPGYYYFYLNYTRIMISEAVLDNLEEDSENVQAERIEDFPKVWDCDYYYFHYLDQCEREGKYGNVLKARGKGFSYKGGSMLTRNYTLIPKSKNYALASEKEYLIRDALLNDKAWTNLDWINDNTAWKKSREYKDQDLHKRASYKDPETRIEKGYKSEIIGITLKDNPQKARGKRGKLILYEESGKFPALIKTWQIARPSMEQGKFVHGLMLAFGTGGTKGADFKSAEELFYHPLGYRIKPLHNIFDKNSEKAYCSFFVPDFLNREGCYDENGNSNVIKAMIEVLKDWESVRKDSSDPNAIIQRKAEIPITPQDAIMRVEGSMFPVAELKEYLSQIQPNINKFTAEHWIGELVNSEDGNIEWRNSTDVHVIREFPIKDNLEKEGGVEIFEPPVRNSNEVIPWGRYIAGCDPYDDDHSTTVSLGSCFVYDLITDRIVAEYTGRPKLATDYYEGVLKLLKYYNAELNYENDKKGLFAYFERRNALKYLCDTPNILKDMEYMKYTPYGNKAKGTNSGKNINSWGRRLQADHLIDQAYGKDEGQINLYTVRSIGYLKELIAWNPEAGNYDRISAMGMLMILREDKAKINVSVDDEVTDLAQDMFWDRCRKRTVDPRKYIKNSYRGLKKLDEITKKL